jgi:hypothetical protein
MDRLPTIAKRSATALALLLITCAFYWKLTLTNQYEWMTGEDLGVQVFGWFQSEAEQWHAGSFPLWDPRLWNGQPTAGQAQPAPLYPLNWFVFGSPLHEGKLQRGYLRFYRVLIHFLALACCFALCRDLGMSRAASLLAGGAFAFDGVIGTSPWPQWVNGASWAPAVFLFLLRSAGSERPVFNAALSGACLGMSFLSGHHQIPIFLGVAWALAWGWAILCGNGRPVAALVSVVVALLSAAPQMLPAVEFGKLSLRWLGSGGPVGWNDAVPHSIHETYAYPPSAFLSIVFPSPPWHVDPHMGAITVVLATLGLALGWKKKGVPMFALVAVTGCAIAFGGWSLLHGVLYGAMPGFEKARNPATAMSLVNFGLAVLAGTGLDALREKAESRWVSRAIGALCAVATVAALGLAFVKRPDVLEQTGVTAVAALAGAAIIHGIRSGAVTIRQATSVLVLIAFLEFSNSLGVLLSPRSNVALDKWLIEMQGHKDIAEYLKSQPGRFRVDVADKDFARNWGAAHGFDVWGGYVPAVTRNVISNETHLRQVKLLWGTAFSISKQPGDEYQQEVMKSPDGYKVFRNEGAFPRVWVVHRVIEVSGQAAINDFIRTRHQELSKGAIATKPYALPMLPCPEESVVNLESHRGTTIEISATMACNGLVVISETFYPGWRAYVDGTPTRILEVNGGMRAFFVPKGAHKLQMRYRPGSVYAGVACAGLAVAGLFVLRRR